MSLVAEAPGPDLLVGTSQRDLVAALAALPSPRRIVAIEHELARTVDLGSAFPLAVVRRASTLDPAAWAGWPDLLWLGLALSPRTVDCERAVAAAWHALPDGALVAAVDLAAVPDPATRSLLRDDFGLDPDRDTHALLRRHFAALSWLDAGHPQGLWRSWWFLGAKVADREW